MASIIEAAKWMNEGKKVKRPGWRNTNFFLYRAESYDGDPIIAGPMDDPENQLDTEDLLAGDWEVAE